MTTPEQRPTRAREGFPPGVPCWIDTERADPKAAAAFYGGLFGWRFEERGTTDDGARYLVATLHGSDVAAIAAARPGASPSPMWNTYVGVASADAAVARVRDAGGTVIAEPFELSSAGRMAVCADPSGVTFRVWQPRAIKGAQAVNEPGSWNFSELNTDDPDGARRFYGAVFGWEFDEVDLGPSTGIMVRLPGYADFLEQFDPGIRQRHNDFGAPPGYSECVAWILPLSGEGASPNWSVTFAVDDTDAVAARSRALGGTPLVEPQDIGPVRSAVIRDPHGAVFTASSFDPGS
jgi:predicted enzyme related to lactoylglutathione lyase